MIVWGKKETKTSLGYAADFCATCREIQVFQIVRFGIASHLYFIALGKGQLTRYAGTCQTCKNSVTVDPHNYQAFVPKLHVDLDDLIQTTHPDVKERLVRRLEADSTLASGGALESESREELLRATFQSFSVRGEKRLGGDSQIDGLSAMVGLATLVVSGFLISAPPVIPALEPIWLHIRVTIFVTGLLLTVFLVFRSGHRWVNRKLIPEMAKRLVDLKPTPEELQKQLTALQRHGLKFGRAVSLDRLERELHDARQLEV